MGEFSDSPKWKLVNDFTIHEDHNLSDRSLMRTCVPKRLDIEISSFEIVRAIEWPSNFGEDAKPDSYADGSYIRFNGDLDDLIIVFTMADGEVATFRSLTDATIKPLRVGQIGGKHKATSFDGIAYSGMSSHDVPAAGLMEGEPGALTFLSEYEERQGSGDKTPASLTATLFLDEDKLSRFLAPLAVSSRPVKMFKLQVLAELFESEMSASLSEPWMTHCYGLLMKGDVGIASARARIEFISISAGETIMQKHDTNADRDAGDLLPTMHAPRPTEVTIPDHSKALLRYQRYTLLALLVLIAVTLFSH